MKAASPKGSQWKLFLRLLELAKFQRSMMVLALSLTLLQSAMAALQPVLYQYGIDRIILAGKFDQLESFSLVLFGWLLVQALLGFSNSYLGERIGQSVILKLRQYVYEHLTRLRLSFFDKTPVGTAVTRSISDIQTITDLFSAGVITVAGDCVQIILILVCMFSMNTPLTLITLSVIPLLLLAANQFRKGIRDSFQDVRSQVSKLNAFLQERITGMSVVQLFNRESQEAHKFESINADHRDANIRSIFYYAVFFPLVDALVALSFALIVWYGSMGMLHQELAFGELMAFIMFINLFFRPVRAIADRFNNIQMGIVAAERIFELIDNQAYAESLEGESVNRLQGAIQFDGVWFAYKEENWVLKDLSFEVEPGKTLALVGHTGSGKTSIANLVSQLYVHQKGLIALDGHPIQDLNLSQVRKQVALVLQDVFLFSGSIEDNIRLNDPDLPSQAIREAAERIGAYSFIDRLPGGFEYNVMERGLSLSLGQRQLISFIRALAFDPAILVLDEATSSIDSETEQLIQRAIEALLHNRTAIIIAHRLSTIKHADQILVLDQGRIVERGNHEQLMAHKGSYSQLYATQMTGH
ncbi:MAG: ABC transporter ATP-binding protein [Bacteroidia bacterium]